MTNKEENICLIALTIFVVILIAVFTTSCGYEAKEFRPGYNLYMDSEGFDLVKDLINDSVDYWEGFYGACPYEVSIILREFPWNYHGIQVAGMMVGNNRKRCVLAIGVHRTSECQTARVFWHEMYHCCMLDYDHFIEPGEEDQIYGLERLPEGTTNWTHGLTYMSYDFRDDGKCIEGDTELYDPYPFK